MPFLPAAGVYYCAFNVCFLLCKGIDLAWVHTGPSNLKIPVCTSAGSYSTEVSSDQSCNRKSSLREMGRGRSWLKANWPFPDSFPAQHSRAQLISWCPTPTTWVHMCVSAQAHILYTTTLLFHVVPRDSPYQIGFVRETGAGPDTTTALDRRRSYGAITPKKSKSCPLFKLASIQSNVLYVRFFFSPFVFLKRKT